MKLGNMVNEDSRVRPYQTVTTKFRCRTAVPPSDLKLLSGIVISLFPDQLEIVHAVKVTISQSLDVPCFSDAELIRTCKKVEGT